MGPGDDTTSAVEATGPVPARPGRPARGGALWWARRVVLGVRGALVALAVVAAVNTTQTWPADVAAAQRWGVVMMVAIAAIPLGGLVWWVERSTPTAWRSRERARTIGRWARAAVAFGGLAAAAYGYSVDDVDLGVVAFFVVMASPVPYLVITAIGNARSEPVWGPPPGQVSGDVAVRPSWRRHRQAHSRRVVDATWKTLFDPIPGEPRSALTIRPHPPEPGAPVLRGMAAWLRHGMLGTDGSTLAVTGRSGRTYRIPLAGADGPSTYGVAALVVVRETVWNRSDFGRSIARVRELLCVVDSTDQRLLDVELYGWTRSDLVALARAAGLRLERYAPEDEQEARSNLRGRTTTRFDEAVPRAAAHRTVPGRPLWWVALPAIALMIVFVSGGVWITEELPVLLAASDDAKTITGLVALVYVFGTVLGGRPLVRRYYQRRQAARARSHDAP